MTEKTYKTPCGTIHYWLDLNAKNTRVTLVFLPGLTADHRLFDKQIEFFEGKYPVFVWDAPGHASSWPFEFSFDLNDKARWLDEIFRQEQIEVPVIIGQSMGGYVGQAYTQLFPDKLKGFISIDSAPLQRKYVTDMEIWLLKRMEPVYRRYPWKWLLKSGTNGVAVSEYGRALMRGMMMVYDGDQDRYAKISGHGFRILAEAMAADLPYQFQCPALLICGEKDHAGSCIRYNKAWHKKTGIPIHWIKNAGHNSNTDQPDTVNDLILSFVEGLQETSNTRPKKTQSENQEKGAAFAMRRLIVDRFEGEYAVCEDENQQYCTVEISRLPEGAGEGAVLSISDEGIISLDREETARRRERIGRKQSEFFGC